MTPRSLVVATLFVLLTALLSNCGEVKWEPVGQYNWPAHVGPKDGER